MAAKTAYGKSPISVIHRVPKKQPLWHLA